MSTNVLLPGFREAPLDEDFEEFYINMGPQHPSTHGALRLVLRLDGEKIIDLEHSDKVAVIGMGGSALKDWVNREYLKKFGYL